MQENKEQKKVGRSEFTDEEQKRKKRKKRALIFAAVVLVAIAVVIPLTALDYDALFQKFTGRNEKEIIYFDPDYESNIFENEEYLSHLGMDMTFSINADGIGTYTYPFTDLPSAAEAVETLHGYNSGAGLLGDYFYALLQGCNSRSEQARFKELFADDMQSDLPLSFPPQKVYKICLTYGGIEEYNGEKTEKWRVSFEVVRNDGTVLNYTGSRDGGQAWFFLRDAAGGEYEIALILPIISLN